MTKKEPILVIMAAGMGSRYGGLKQIDPLNEQGDLIIDFSIYDALKAGFKKIIFLIKHEIEADFKNLIGDRISKIADVAYAYQEVNTLPEGFVLPPDRKKPWGTGHAVLSCKNVIDGPFAVINADDYYGRDAFKKIYDKLCNCQDDEQKYHYAMVGYQLENTLTDHGHVARGVCVTDETHHLTAIHERTHIEKREKGAVYTEDDGATWTAIPEGSTVSMNIWGFTESMLTELEFRFPRFLEQNLGSNPLKCEYFLPEVVGQLLNEGKADVEVLKSADKWYGVTYREDKAVVVNAMKRLKEQGVYPELLWEGR